MLTTAQALAPSVSTPEAGFGMAAELLRALANPHRLAIVRELDGQARCVHELVEALGVSQPLVSQHLRVLRASHLVQAERRGRRVSERTLLRMAWYGGWVGALTAVYAHRARHKTRQVAFLRLLWLAVVAWSIGVGVLVLWAITVV